MFKRKKANGNVAPAALVAQTPPERPVQAPPEMIEPSEPVSVPCRDGVVIIGKGTQVSGTIGTCQVLEVHGVVEADVTTERLIVREGGGIRGQVQADNAEISGVVEGSLVCYEHLEITSTGEVWADVKYQTLTVAKGAVVKGSVWNDVPGDNHVGEARPAQEFPEASLPSIDHDGFPKRNGTRVDTAAKMPGGEARQIKRSTATTPI